MIEHPFPGLRPFETDEDHLFFGRDEQSDEILRRLRVNRFVAVVGTSGTGKSSLIRAGLLPSLHGGFMVRAGSRWRIAVFRPGDRPTHNLAVALTTGGVLGNGSESPATNTMIVEATLRRSGLGLIEAIRQARIPADENLLIVVDQFEELFRFRSESETDQQEQRAAAFVKLLIEASRQEDVPIYVVITMRSDFLGHCARFRELPEVINEGLYLIPLMTRAQHREAIDGPIAVAGGGKASPALVDRLLNDIGDNPEQLPIMQHALMRTWKHWVDDHREGESLDLRHYEEVGGMAEALSRHADEAYNELSEKHQQLAEKIFKVLTEKRPGNPGVRRPTRIAELSAITEASEADVIAVVERFRAAGRSFLMPPPDVRLDSETLIDISHESLISGWKRLRDWVEGEALSAAIYRRVADAAELYEKKQTSLWRDPELQIALGWQQKARPNKAWGEHYHSGFEAAMSFLKKSKEDVQKRRRQALIRARITAGIFGLLFIAATGMAIFAFNQKRIADNQRAEIQKEKKKSDDLVTQLNVVVEALGSENVQRKLAEERTTAALHDAELARNKAQEQERQAKIARDKAMTLAQVAKNERSLFQNAAIRAQMQNETDKSIITTLTDLLIERSSPAEAVRWRGLKAAALTEVNEHVRAEEELSKALKTFPDNTDLRMSRGYMYMLTQKIPQSIEDFEFIIKADPKSSLAYLNKSISEGILGRYEQASSSTQAAIDNMMPGTYGFLSETEVCPEVVSAMGYPTIVASENAFAIALHYQLANIKAFQGAEEFVEKLRSAKHARGESHDRNAYLTAINWAWLHMRNKPNDYGGFASQGAMWEESGADYCHQALDAYEQFQRNHKEKRDARYGRLAEWVKQRQRVTTHRCRIPRLDYEADAQTLAAQAESSINRADFEDAYDKLTEAIKLDPKNIYLLARRANVSNRLQNFEESRDDAARVLKLAGGKPVPQASILLAMATVNPDEREKILRDIVKDYPKHTEALSLLSEHLEEKDPTEAIRLLNRLTELLPYEDSLHFKKAELQLKNKRYRDALESNKKAIAINRGESDYYTQRMKIEKELATNPEDVERSKAAGFDELADLMARQGQTKSALDHYETSLKSLASIARNNNDSALKIGMTVTMHKMIRLVEQQESGVKAVEILEEMKREFADFQDLRTLLEDRLKHLQTNL